MKNASLIIFLVVAGCVPAKHSQMVQICLRHGEVLTFRDVLVEFAETNEGKYIDNSAETEKYVRSVPAALEAARQSFPLIDIKVVGKHGGRMSAGNLGLPSNQIVVGFSDVDREHGRRFAEAGLKALRGRWRLYRVPPNRGAVPLEVCDSPNQAQY